MIKKTKACIKIIGQNVDSAVKDEEIGIQCEIWEIWLHVKCENISNEGYKVLQLDNTHWYCCGCRNILRKFSLTDRISNVWNSLPDDIVTALSTNLFENKLDQFLGISTV